MAKINLISLGCPKNLMDAEMMLHKLREAGHEITPNEVDADLLIVNTCGFIEPAKNEAIETILEVSVLKEEGNNLKALVVTGCLAERYGAQIREQLPEVDAVVSLGKNADIVSIVEEALNGKKQTYTAPKNSHILDGGRIQSTPFYTAYLRIADGCSNCCSYCAIPSIRGPFRSRTMQSVLDEARELVQNGVRELVLIAQDTTRFGEDTCDKQLLPELLRRLSEIEELRWIRILYAYPERVTDELIAAIAECDKVVKYLELPIQHVNGEMLAAMNRNGNRETLTALIEKLRTRIPGITLRTTVICGFPGESEAQFEELLAFIKETRFDRLGAFAFSPEEDTPAYDMPNQLDDEVKQRRADQIMDVQSYIAAELNAAKIGTETEAVVEGWDGYIKCYHGRTTADAPDFDGKVFIKSTKKLKNGEFLKIIVTDEMDYDIIAKLAE